MFDAIPILLYPVLAMLLLGLFFMVLHPLADRLYHSRRRRRHAAVKAVLHDHPV
ncbi:MAG: hypothetical protein RIQ52_1554 [Pseudomonadota bacterium]|jgi:peptidoglycan biosynthesis protein MviN/MurJ (putative lipid II flippase)